ncbi:MAG: tRNA (adenosine(37)-N6)-threonylcarbamoyltransferase complex ATPase subunit type 1 TsaE [Candidatus Hatepunaea meridiana]|nr:tRNA (adenosine(37)-N6)-threonylcarbamoyltransferase complex ATPase subunit type 1 TsaE [Candidatus Hatepunaea meridiana]
MTEIITYSPEETIEFGKKIAKGLSPGDVVALTGELGVGKTLLTKGICYGLGYLGEVTSPSYVRVHSYSYTIPIYHIDFYLLRSEEEVFDLGLDEIYGSDGIVIVEWAQRFPKLLPHYSQWIKIEWIDGTENARKIRDCK